MKKHILSLFSTANRLWTVSFLVTSLVLIIVSLSIGMKNNLPMNLMFVSGISILYLALIHTWRKANNYIKLMVITLIIFILFFFTAFVVSNINFNQGLPSPSKIHVIVGALYTIVGLCICIPGMIVGLLGSLIFGYREYRVIKA